MSPARCDQCACVLPGDTFTVTLPWSPPLAVLLCRACRDSPAWRSGQVYGIPSCLDPCAAGLVRAIRRTGYGLAAIPGPVLATFDRVFADAPARALHRFEIGYWRGPREDGHWWRRETITGLQHRHTISLPALDEVEAVLDAAPLELHGLCDWNSGDRIERGLYVLTRSGVVGPKGIVLVTVDEVPSLYSEGAIWAAGGPILCEWPETPGEWWAAVRFGAAWPPSALEDGVDSLLTGGPLSIYAPTREP